MISVVGSGDFAQNCHRSKMFRDSIDVLVPATLLALNLEHDIMSRHGISRLVQNFEYDIELVSTVVYHFAFIAL